MSTQHGSPIFVVELYALDKTKAQKPEFTHQVENLPTP
jgi:hypothetical protein